MQIEGNMFKLVGYSFQMDDSQRLGKVFAVFAEKWQDPEHLKERTIIEKIYGQKPENQQIKLDSDTLLSMIITPEAFLTEDSYALTSSKEVLKDMNASKLKQAFEGIYPASRHLTDSCRFIPVTRLGVPVV